MGNQVVSPTPQKSNIIVNFAATNGNLEGKFTPKTNCNIKSIETTNVATINISVGQSLTSGVQVVFTITKSNANSTARVVIRTTDSGYSETINVIDYSALSLGRYAFILYNDNTIDRIDYVLGESSNYQGGGMWATSPITTTIKLPSLPTNYSWQKTEYIVIEGVEYELVVGSSSLLNISHNPTFCLIRLSDNTVWNLTLTTQNAYTQYSIAGQYGKIQSVIYNYVNNYIYFTNSGNSGYAPVFIDLNNKSISSYSYQSQGDVALRSLQGLANTAIDPEKSRLLATNISIDSHSAAPYGEDYRFTYTINGKFCHCINGYYVVSLYNDTLSVEFFSGKIRSGSYSSGTAVPTNPYSTWNKFNGKTAIFLANSTTSGVINKLGFIDFSNTSAIAGFRKDVTFVPTVQTGFICVTSSNHNGLFLAIGNSTSNPTAYFYEVNFNTNTATERYLSLTKTPVACSTNRLKI